MPPREILKELYWADLFPSWEKGIANTLRPLNPHFFDNKDYTNWVRFEWDNYFDIFKTHLYDIP
jgi:hypothetical protein